MGSINVKYNPKGMFSESIKTIRTNINFSNINNENEIKVILVSSSQSGDGKSFISANLAYSFSLEGKNVLLVDCDLRKGRLKEYFEMDTDKGYSDLILNYKPNTRIGSYINKTKYENLSVLLGGTMPPNPLELLSSKNNSVIMEKLKEKYDVIILDCPPVIGLSDALVMAKYSDYNALVVSNKKTTNKELELSLRAFENVGMKVNGVIMNKVAKKNNSYYSSYYTNSYYGD
ncbi:MAG: CpsD/CapB family tyrosine-protein kinase [Bacilli bacterium]|nr:CpsD/CapB family tyrosine-protein kinase [Bacilli bacterium]